MKTRFVVLLFLGVLLSACTGMRSFTTVPVNPSPDQSEMIQKKRFLRVGIVAENFSENMVGVVKKGFKKLEDKHGIAVGAVTFIPVSFAGVKTMSQMWKEVFAQVLPRGPRQADIFAIFSSRPFIEDLFILGGTGPTFGAAELVFDRFVLLRVPSSTLLVHEVEHLFGARDSWYPAQNLQKILSRKWRDFSGWYIQNHPELDMFKEPEKQVWTAEEYIGVVERAKERAKVKMEEFYKKYPFLRDWKTPWQFNPNWEEGSPLPEKYLDQVERHYDQITNLDLVGLKEVEERRKRK